MSRSIIHFAEFTELPDCFSRAHIHDFLVDTIMCYKQLFLIFNSVCLTLSFTCKHWQVFVVLQIQLLEHFLCLFVLYCGVEYEAFK